MGSLVMKVSGGTLLLFVLLMIGTIGLGQLSLESGAAGVVAIVEPQLLSAERHPIAAPYVRGLRDRGGCEGTEIWFSVARGTVMLVCGMPKSVSYGIFVWRITENNAAIILPRSTAYECTVFVGSYQYVQNKIVEGAYLPLAVFPDIQRAWRDYFGRGAE